MGVILGVTTCDKCGEPMKVGQEIVTIGLGTVARENRELEVLEPEIRYACHLSCWDGIEELTSDGASLFSKE
jgi:hypothetical protein